MQDATQITMPKEAWRIVQASLLRSAQELHAEGQDGMAQEILDLVLPMIEQAGTSVPIQMARRQLRKKVGLPPLALEGRSDSDPSAS